MSISYKINFDALRQDGLKPLFEALERGFNFFGIDFYLIGAIARDKWFANKGILPLGTKDVDFAIYIPAKEDYEKLKKYLNDKEGFNTSTQNEFVVFSPERGINIFLNEYKKHIGNKAEFFIPDEIEKMIRGKGNSNNYNTQIYREPILNEIRDEGLIDLVKIIHKHKKGLEQEYLINEPIKGLND